jgi:hypothetical protein
MEADTRGILSIRSTTDVPDEIIHKACGNRRGPVPHTGWADASVSQSEWRGVRGAETYAQTGQHGPGEVHCYRLAF